MSKFNAFIPLHVDEELLEKARKATGEDRYDNMILEGLASDATEDTDGEELHPDGFDIRKFLKSGLINYEHLAKKSPKNIIGEPIAAKVTNNKFWIKAKLYKAVALARELWDSILDMKESGSTRLPGWSIEGSAKLRDPYNPKRVTKALITHCALTFAPKNANTWADIAKGEQAEDFVNYEFDQQTANGGKTYLLEVEGVDGSLIRVNKDFSVQIIRKAMSAGTQTGRELNGVITSGASLKAESLDKKLKKLQPEFRKSIITVSNNMEILSLKDLEIIRNSVKNFL